MGKIRKSKEKTDRHLPLSQQLQDDSFAKPTGRTKIRSRSEEINVVDDKLTDKIIQNAVKQQDELQEEYGSNSKVKERQATILPDNRRTSDSDAESESDNEDKDYSYDPVEINEEDEKAIQMFMGKNPTARKTLTDIIREKISEKHTEILTQLSDGQPNIVDLDPKVVEMYRGVRVILSKYRSGKLPKAFKIISSLSNWEQILAITEPSGWSAAAMYQATRIFASNLKERMAQRFFNLVLLPRIRDDIFEFKRLNFHLYQALRKSLFKPGAFFKGILLPLCEAGDCTLREAIIIGSVISKNSIPVLHSSAAMLKIAEMDYNGANSIFLRILFDKKYALPYRVIDAVVYHFLRFETDKRELPVLWHQSLLVFVQRYKEDISSEQKEALQELIKVHTHHGISPEIRRELQNSKCRDKEMSEPMST